MIEDSFNSLSYIKHKNERKFRSICIALRVILPFGCNFDCRSKQAL